MIKINKEVEKNIVMMVSKMSDDEVLQFLNFHWDDHDVTEEERKEHLENNNHRYMVHQILVITASCWK